MVPGYRIAVAGSTGLVGRELIGLLAARSFPLGDLRLIASERSKGLRLDGHVVESFSTVDPREVDVAFFCAGASLSRSRAPLFAAAGTWVIDNSSAFRTDPAVPLVVPEVNDGVLETAQSRLIANPNCATIISLLPLAALDRAFGLDRVLVTTFQAISGAGRGAMNELMEQTEAYPSREPPPPRHFGKPILHNLIPLIGEEDDSGFCGEERKIAFESRKILDRPGLMISATTVRVPVARCHSISLWFRLKREVGLDEIRAALAAAPGVRIETEPSCPGDLKGTDLVHLCRLRKDPDERRAFWAFAVSDQLRKGAALNAVQIAESLMRMGKLK